MTSTTFQLKRGEETPFVFRDIAVPQQPPATPSEWFARRFSAEVKRWGCPFLEAVVEDVETGRKLTTPVSMNCNFFAAALSDSQLGHSVVYYEPEQQWIYLEPRDGCYHTTSEAKLMTLLSALLVRAAEEMPANVDKVNLFVKFREEERLKAVVKQARSVLAADSTFFSINNPNKRVEGPEQQGQMAKRFVGRWIKPEPGRLLSIGQCYDGFSGFCRNNGVEPVARGLFRRMIVEIIKEEFEVGFRSDLKSTDGRYLRGWKGLTVDIDARN